MLASLSSTSFPRMESTTQDSNTLQQEALQPRLKQQEQQSEGLTAACLTNSPEECPGTLALSTAYQTTFTVCLGPNPSPCDGVGNRVQYMLRVE